MSQEFINTILDENLTLQNDNDLQKNTIVVLRARLQTEQFKNKKLEETLNIINSKCEILSITKEIDNGIISDLKLKIKEYKFNTFQLEKNNRNSAALFTFNEEPEPFVMEIVALKPYCNYLHEFNIDTKC